MRRAERLAGRGGTVGSTFSVEVAERNGPNLARSLDKTTLTSYRYDFGVRKKGGGK